MKMGRLCLNLARRSRGPRLGFGLRPSVLVPRPKTEDPRPVSCLRATRVAVNNVTAWFVMLKHNLRTLICFVAGWMLLGFAATAEAQVQVRPNTGPSSSLLGDPSGRRPLTMADVSWTYQPSPEPKKWKLNDLVTVLVQEKTTMSRNGMVDQRRKDTRSATLSDWVLLKGFSLVPDPQSGGDPTVGALIDNKYQAQANLQNKDLFEAEIQCVVVDIRPNGTLVIEGHGKVQTDEEQWELSLSGVVQPDDILPNKTIKSEKIAEKRIQRQSAGHGRDGLRRGWFLKFWDKYSPF